MALNERPSYLKAAFLNVYNLSLLGGAAVVAGVTHDYVVAALAAGVEALWLLFGPDSKPFQRVVDRAQRDEREVAERKRIKQAMEELPERDWARARALEELRKEIERDMQQNPTFQAVLLQPELDKLQHLFVSFVTLARACARAETYLSSTDSRDLQRQIEAQKSVEKNMQDQAVREIAHKNVQVLERRVTSISDIQNFLARARGQMNLIENSVRFLRDQVLTMASPDQLGEQLDDLLTGVDAIQSSAKEQEAILSRIQLEPVAPLPETAGESATRNRVR